MASALSNFSRDWMKGTNIYGKTETLCLYFKIVHTQVSLNKSNPSLYWWNMLAVYGCTVVASVYTYGKIIASSPPPPTLSWYVKCYNSQSDRETSWERINWPPHHPGVMKIKIFPKTSSKSAWANWSSMLFFSSPEVALSNMMEASSAHRSLSWTSWIVKRSPLT